VVAPVFLFTPPFTQLNTPYPATAYLKGFLNTKKIPAFQADLGIEVTLALFCKSGIEGIFNHIKSNKVSTTANEQKMIALANEYIATVDAAIAFLQGKMPTLADQIAKKNLLPEAGRFAQLENLEWAFGSMGIQDRAKYITTMYLEDLSDLIKNCVDEHFGFSRYAERLGRSANTFDELYHHLHLPPTYVDEILLALLAQKMEKLQPKIVCISVPFPGNLYTALRCGKWIKTNYPTTKIILGGGFANTELRSLKDSRVFEFLDFITLDDGEAPIENLYHHIVSETIPLTALKRTFTLVDGAVTFINNKSCQDYKQGDVGTPDYSDFNLDKYISAIEVVNPMHRLWSDGRWNKLTMAHGCYWGKCTFCDTSLPYIKDYEPIAATVLVDRMQEMIDKTGETGFHFVDEAAPPALMKALAIEIIKRKLIVSWWTNVRFEKSFTRDLCLLLKAAGCIAVSGGLEVASDRLLQLIDKGITVAQVAVVNKHFTEAGIMVHAYLMYGFPTQTAQETIDSLEMVRQLFATNVLQSAFWHQFAMTAHSPVGLAPEKFGVRKASEVAILFADNDVAHIDSTGTEHEAFSYGLKKSLFNYMHGLCLDDPLHKWFDFKVPKTTVAPNFIEQCLVNETLQTYKPTAKVIWLGKLLNYEIFTQSKKGNSREMMRIQLLNKQAAVDIQINKDYGEWLLTQLPRLDIYSGVNINLQQLKDSFENNFPDEDFELFWDNKPMNTLHKVGMLVV